MESHDIDVLYAGIAEQLLAANANKYSRRHLTEIGARWFARHKDLIQAAVCSSLRVRAAFESDAADPEKTELVAAIIDALSTLTLGVAPTLVTLVILRKGLPYFCESHWD